MKTKTDQAWDELCSAAERPSAPAPAPAPVSTVHPFLKLGPSPWKFVSLDQGSAKCALCGTRIKNLYSVSDGSGAVHLLGSECILSLGNGFSAHLVGAVKTAKSRYDKTKRDARKKLNREKDREESRKIFPRETAWLEAYAGNFDFYLSLKGQYMQNGGLSDRQWESVTKAVARADAPRPVRAFTLEVGTTLIVSKFIAFKIGEATGLNKPHFAIEVLEVQAESEKAYKIKGRLSAQRTSRCCVCGLGLTNAVSVLNGIGPICAERFNVTTTEELHAKLMTEYKATVDLWLPKSQIKERKETK